MHINEQLWSKRVMYISVKELRMFKDGENISNEESLPSCGAFVHNT